jgi:hypothetical protein
MNLWEDQYYFVWHVHPVVEHIRSFFGKELEVVSRLRTFPL